MKTFRDTVLELGARIWSLNPPTPSMVVVLKATFDLENGGTAKLSSWQEPCTDGLYHEDDPEQTVRYSSDYALAKPQSEVLLMGHCHAPHGEPITKTSAEFAVGRLSKRISVFGNRFWRIKDESVFLSQPLPFVSIPLRWERAFGGPGYQENPVGLGIEEDFRGLIPLPNLEDPENTIRSPRQRPSPMSASPLPSTWTQRVELIGSLDEEWKNTRCPFPPADFDTAYFNAAPADLRQDGAFRGDEVIALRNFMRDDPELVTRLPGLRPRVFLEWNADRGGAFDEVTLFLDTITIDTDEITARCTWRGRVELPGSKLQATGVARLFVMDEPLDQQTPIEKCRATLLAKVEQGVLVADSVEPELGESFMALPQGLNEEIAEIGFGAMGSCGEWEAAMEMVSADDYDIPSEWVVVDDIEEDGQPSVEPDLSAERPLDKTVVLPLEVPAQGSGDEPTALLDVERLEKLTPAPAPKKEQRSMPTQIIDLEALQKTAPAAPRAAPPKSDPTQIIDLEALQKTAPAASRAAPPKSDPTQIIDLEALQKPAPAAPPAAPEVEPDLGRTMSLDKTIVQPLTLPVGNEGPKPPSGHPLEPDPVVGPELVGESDSLLEDGMEATDLLPPVTSEELEKVALPKELVDILVPEPPMVEEPGKVEPSAVREDTLEATSLLPPLSSEALEEAALPPGIERVQKGESADVAAPPRLAESREPPRVAGKTFEQEAREATSLRAPVGLPDIEELAISTEMAAEEAPLPWPPPPAPESFLVKNETPFPHGTKLTSLNPPKPAMSIVVRGRFDLVPDGIVSLPDAPEGLDPIVQGPLSGDLVKDDDEERAGELLYPNDFADFKVATDVILLGSCHTPDGQPLARCPVSFQVGSWKKALWVFGRRIWKEGFFGPKACEPKPFTEMPIEYSHAFGGKGYDANPIGLGVRTPELPNIESADQPLRTPRDRPAPAGFGPINPEWPQRSSKRGKEYGELWRKTRAPFFSNDFDWTFFNAAPSDQQLEGFLNGDEELRIQNLNREHSVMTTRLPGLRLRCFVNDREKRFREVPMNLDTLLVDAGEGQVLLTWRGVTPVVDADFDDVTTVLIDSEPIEEEPRSEAHYREKLEKFEADPLELDDKLLPEEVALFKAKAGGDTTAAVRALEAVIERDSPGKLDEIAQRLPEGVNLEEVLAESLEDSDAPPPVPIPVAPRIFLGMDTTELEKQLVALRAIDAEKADEVTQKLNDPALVEIDPNYRPLGSPPPPDDEPGPGADLSGRNLSGEDLSGMDLTGAKLVGSILMKTNLQGVNLTGADLTGAMLFKANLAQADLEGADLTKVNAAQASLVGANLRETVLEQAYFGKADLRRARLDRARGEWCFFTEADLTEARLVDVVLAKADFEGARIERANFEGALLERCLLYKCFGHGVRMAKTSLHGCCFAESDLTGALLEEAVGQGSNWTKTVLADADLSYSSFIESFFDRARAERVSFRCANLQAARFTKAELEGATFVNAKLVYADLSKSWLGRASFAGANLFAAQLVGTAGEQTDFTNANLERSVT